MTRLTPGRDSNERSLCVFDRAGRTLALPVWTVREVLGGEAMSPVPCAPAQIAGAINVRGEPLVLVQIDDWIGARYRPLRTADQILVLECDQIHAGLLVDRVRDICQCEHALSELTLRSDWPGPLVRREWARNRPGSEAELVAVLDPKELIEALTEVARATLRLPPGDPSAAVQDAGRAETIAESAR